MANLLLLADVASKNSSSKPKTVDVSVQTEFYFGGYECEGSRPFFQHFSGNGPSTDGAGGKGNHFELPNLPPSHDYVKQTEFDFVVNAMHDYYNRLEPPVRELEHSYAFFGEDVSDPSAANYFADDGCFESIANLDEYMGIAPATLPDQSLLCEEVINDDHLFVDGALGRFGGDELFDQLSICSVDVQAVVPMDDLDELIQYILPLEEQAKIVQVQPEPLTVSIIEGQKATVVGEASTNCEETRLENHDSAPSCSYTETNIDRQASPLRCEWKDCGYQIEVADCGGIEKHILKEHLHRKRKTEQGVSRWVCQWRGCNRTAAFAQRYQLLRHLRQHTLEAPFACEICRRAFKTKELLRVHERRFHNRYMSYVCGVCSKSFASTGDLSRHKRVHQNNVALAFTCGDCGISYKEESGLRKHKKRVHVVSEAPMRAKDSQNVTC